MVVDLGLWLTLVPTTAGPAAIPLGVISVFTTIQTVAVLALMAIAVRVGRETARRPAVRGGGEGPGYGLQSRA